jgi:hypothetical protein
MKVEEVAPDVETDVDVSAYDDGQQGDRDGAGADQQLTRPHLPRRHPAVPPAGGPRVAEAGCGVKPKGGA